MNRRQAVMAMAVASVGVPVSTLAENNNTIEDKYWEAQWLIGELEQYRSEMAAHAKAKIMHRSSNG